MGKPEDRKKGDFGSNKKHRDIFGAEKVCGWLF